MLPLLYQSVDLSCHNDPGLWPTPVPPGCPDDDMVESNNPDRATHHSFKGLKAAQDRFVDRILQKPQLADWVVALRGERGISETALGCIGVPQGVGEE